jgi:glycosyltransferase involved in cell wall biosynthesis
VLYWVNQFAVAPDQPGGTRHFEMSRELVRRGRRTVVVASDLSLSTRGYLRRRSARDRSHLDEVVDGVEFHWLPAGSYERNDWRRAASMLVFSVHVLVHLLRAPMPRGTVVIGSTPHLPGAAAARLVAWVRRVPFVLEVRDLWPESLLVAGTEPGLLYRALRLLADVLYRSSSRIVVFTRGNIEAVVARGVDAGRISYVPNGVDTSAFAAAEPTAVPGVPAGSGRAPFVYAGAHGPANGLDVVLEAARVLQDRGDQRIHVTLLGDGPSKRDLEEQARRSGLRNVTLAPPVPKSEIPGILKAATAGIMPLANVELFAFGVSPNKLFDYLSAGLAVVTNVPGDVAGMVTEAGAGLVVPPDDPEALADAMASIAEDPAAFAGGSAWVREHHDRDLLVTRLEEVIDDVRTPPRRRPRGR